MRTKIWSKVASLLLVFVFAVPAMANTIYTYSAVGTASPVTTGTDPFGNPWQISSFSGMAVWSIPGLSSLMAGSGPCQWQGPECLVGLTVRSWAVAGPTDGGDLPLDPQLVFLPGAFRNMTSGIGFSASYPIHGNISQFTAAVPGAEVNIGELVTGYVFVQLGSPSGQYRFDVTYETAPCPVPEPGTYVLVGISLTGLGLWKRRRLV